MCIIIMWCIRSSLCVPSCSVCLDEVRSDLDSALRQRKRGTTLTLSWLITRGRRPATTHSLTPNFQASGFKLQFKLRSSPPNYLRDPAAQFGAVDPRTRPMRPD